MKRVWVMMVTATSLVVAGCGVGSYDRRTEATLQDMKLQQKINTYLQPAAQGKFKELNVWLRVPKPMVEGPFALNQTPGMFDHAATFIGSPPAAAPPASTQPGAPAPAAPAALPPLRIHALVRQKPKKATAKKGAPAPPVDPNIANRGNFVADVRAVLAAEYGPDAASDKQPQPIKENALKRQLFTATNGNAVQVYFADFGKGELEVALVFDIPTAIQKLPMVTTGRELCLSTFRLGTRARALFSGEGNETSKASEAEGPAF